MYAMACGTIHDTINVQTYNGDQRILFRDGYSSRFRYTHDCAPQQEHL